MIKKRSKNANFMPKQWWQGGHIWLLYWVVAGRFNIIEHNRPSEISDVLKRQTARQFREKGTLYEEVESQCSLFSGEVSRSFGETCQKSSIKMRSNCHHSDITVRPIFLKFFFQPNPEQFTWATEILWDFMRLHHRRAKLFQWRSRISQTGRGGGSPQDGDANLFFGQNFPENCMKMKKIGSKGTASLAPLLDPPCVYNSSV